MFNLKGLEFGAFLPTFTFFRYLKVMQFFQMFAKLFHFRHAFRQKEPFEDNHLGFKFSFQRSLHLGMEIEIALLIL